MSPIRELLQWCVGPSSPGLTAVPDQRHSLVVPPKNPYSLKLNLLLQMPPAQFLYFFGDERFFNSFPSPG